MFRYSLLINDLLKALTHKYIRRVPKGVTKTGATKYVYYYAGQEGHGQGIAHESELVQGASFAFGEHGKTRYHAHITKVDGDKLTIKYDDGDKKDKEETMTKKQFQALLHGEHKESIKQAQIKAEKQLKDAKTGKEKGVKFKQATLDKLENQVNKLKQITTQKEETQETPEIQQYKDTAKNVVSLYRAMKPLSINNAPVRFQNDSLFIEARTFSDMMEKDYKDKSPDDISRDITTAYSQELARSEDDETANRNDTEFIHRIVNPMWDDKPTMITFVNHFDKDDWNNRIKPALTTLGISDHKNTLNFNNLPYGQARYSLPVSSIIGNTATIEKIKDIFAPDKMKNDTKEALTESQKDYIDEHDNSKVMGLPSYIYDVNDVGTDIEEFSTKNAKDLHLFVEGSFDDKDKLFRKYGLTFYAKHPTKRGVSYYWDPKSVATK